MANCFGNNFNINRNGNSCNCNNCNRCCPCCCPEASTVAIGTVITAEPDIPAGVSNSGTATNAVLNFIIPRGATGPAGPQGPRGATGAAGATGPQGPAGTANAASFGSFYATGEVTIPAGGGAFPLANTIAAKDITLNTTTGVVTLPNAGIYKIDFAVTPGTVETGDAVSIYVNGAELAGTKRALVNNDTTGASAIVPATAGSTLNIQITADAAVSFTGTGTNVVGYLTIVQIG